MGNLSARVRRASWIRPRAVRTPSVALTLPRAACRLATVRLRAGVSEARRLPRDTSVTCACERRRHRRGARRAGTSRALHFVKWTLAMVGVLALYLLLQIVVSLIGGTVIVSISFAVGGAGTEVGDALFDNGIQVVMAVSQLIAAAIFGLWWRRVRLGSFAGRRGAGASAAPRHETIASLLLVGFAAQFFVSGILGFVELFFPETMAEYAELMEDSAVGVFAIIQVISTVILAPLNEEIVCRGVMLEYAMRAVTPRLGPSPPRSSQDRLRARVLGRQRVAGARVRRPPHEHHPGELCLRPGHPTGLGLLANGQARVRHAAALRPQRLVLSRRAVGSHGQRAAHAHRVRSLWGLACRRHRHVRARLARLGRPA